MPRTHTSLRPSAQTSGFLAWLRPRLPLPLPGAPPGAVLLTHVRLLPGPLAGAVGPVLIDACSHLAVNPYADSDAALSGPPSPCRSGFPAGTISIRPATRSLPSEPPGSCTLAAPRAPCIGPSQPRSLAPTGRQQGPPHPIRSQPNSWLYAPLLHGAASDLASPAADAWTADPRGPWWAATTWQLQPPSHSKSSIPTLPNTQPQAPTPLALPCARPRQGSPRAQLRTLDGPAGRSRLLTGISQQRRRRSSCKHSAVWPSQQPWTGVPTLFVHHRLLPRPRRLQPVTPLTPAAIPILSDGEDSDVACASAPADVVHARLQPPRPTIGPRASRRRATRCSSLPQR